MNRYSSAWANASDNERWFEKYKKSYEKIERALGDAPGAEVRKFKQKFVDPMYGYDDSDDWKKLYVQLEQYADMDLPRRKQ